MHTPQSTPRFSPTPAYIAGMGILAIFGFLGQSPPAEAEPAATERVPEPPTLAMTAPATPAPAEKMLQARDPVRVLVLGDSHTTQTFGQALDLLLRSRPQTTVNTVGSCGISPDGFLEGKQTRCGYLTIEQGGAVAKQTRHATPSIDALMTTLDPDVTIIELGANLLFKQNENPEKAKADIRSLAERVSATSQCVWVGPPYGSNTKKPHRLMDDLYALIEGALPESCRFLDSRPEAMPFLDYEAVAKNAASRGDGKHFDHIGLFGRHAARQWALAVFDFVTPIINEARVQKPLIPTRLAQSL